eukprot:164416_1
MYVKVQQQNIANEEEENKYETDSKISDNHYTQQYTLLATKTIPQNINIIESSQGRLSQYLYCKNGHDIAHCMPMKRIIQLLDFCQQQMKAKDMNIFQYLMKSKNYGISNVLEDWHQIKTNHLDDDSFNEWIKNNKHIYCNGNTQCGYNQRYHRDREQQQYPLKIDLANTILMDQIDSIHTFLFHVLPQRQTSISFNNIREIDENDEKQALHISTEQILSSLKKWIPNKLMKHKINITE